ncbi:FK506-binding protein-like [Lytechinus pictus]|uniref:FK506-binding protein-like n=1 Tax=Lytechinus pictus TaxID=7653 RepID=UPI0030B9E80C
MEDPVSEDPFSEDPQMLTIPQAVNTGNVETDSPGDCHFKETLPIQEIEPIDVEMRDETEVWTAPDGSFTKRIIKKGFGFTSPNDGSSCRVTISIMDLYKVENKDVGYPTGEEADILHGDGCGIYSEAIDACLETMHCREQCELQVFESRSVEMVGQTHGPHPVESRNKDWLESNEVASFVVTLHDFTRNKDIHKMSVEDIFSRVSQLKDCGTKCFKEGKLQLAERFYLRAGHYLIMVCHPQDVKDLDDALQQEYNLLKKSCSLNLAACQLKHKRYHDVITHCISALEIDPLNTKALYRRCQAYIALDEFEKARTDIQTALDEEPKSKFFLEQKRLLVKREKVVYNKLSKGMNKMFGGSS